MKNELRRNKKGITLIALVITIIVLLILVGISIGMITSQDGILKKAASQIGGIIVSGYGKITNCYNIGDIKGGSKNILNIGGIDGNGKDNIKSCYNIGNIEIVGGQDIRKGMIIGKNRSDMSKITNVYYKETEGMTAIGNGNIGDNSTMVLTEDKMRNNEEFVTLLNQDGTAWKMDINNINNGYPILSWQ